MLCRRVGLVIARWYKDRCGEAPDEPGSTRPVRSVCRRNMAAAPVTLTTPCTLGELHEWVSHVVDVLESGPEEVTAAVTSTTSTIVVTQT